MAPADIAPREDEEDALEAQPVKKNRAAAQETTRKTAQHESEYDGLEPPASRSKKTKSASVAKPTKDAKPIEAVQPSAIPAKESTAGEAIGAAPAKSGHAVPGPAAAAPPVIVAQQAPKSVARPKPAAAPVEPPSAEMAESEEEDYAASASMYSGRGERKVTKQTRPMTTTTSKPSAAVASSAAAQKPADEQLTFGVYDRLSSTWHIGAIAARQSSTLTQLANMICTYILPMVRGDDAGGNGVNEHLWYFKKGIAGANKKVKWESKSCGAEDPMVQEGKQPLSTLALSEGSWLRFTYDLGTTTEVFLKVIYVGAFEGNAADFPQVVMVESQQFATSARKLLAPLTKETLNAFTKGFFNEQCVGIAQRQQLLETVPARHVPSSQRLDTLFPQFCEALLHCPFFVLGPHNKFTAEHGIPFAFVEGGDQVAMIAAYVFNDLDEFFIACEEAWQPKMEYAHYKRSWITRHVAPSSLSAAEEEDWQDEIRDYEGDPNSRWGAARFFFRMSTMKMAVEQRKLSKKGFSFAKLFPRTAEQWANGRFRWAIYKGGVLRVCVGRASKDFECPRENVLREWVGSFHSVHELMCAVEASWVLPGDSSTALTTQHLAADDDLAPINPPLPCLGAPETAQKVKPAVPSPVTALLLDGINPDIVYSGHANGRVVKWNHAKNIRVWAFRAFEKCGYLTEDDVDSADEALLPVVGMLMSPDDRSIYCWSHHPDIVQIGCDSGNFMKELHPKITGGTRHDNKRWYAPINCAVLCDLPTDDPMIVDRVLLVGLNLEAVSYSAVWVHRYFWGGSDDEEDELGHGNIAVLDRRSGKASSWHGHRCAVTGIAVSADFAVSVSASFIAVDMILWDLHDPGTPLKQVQWYDMFRRVPAKRYWDSIDSVEGICIFNNTIFLYCNYSALIVQYDLTSLCRKGKPIVLNRDRDWGFFMSAAFCGSGMVVTDCYNPRAYMFDMARIEAAVGDWVEGVGLGDVLLDPQDESSEDDESEDEEDLLRAINRIVSERHEEPDDDEILASLRKHISGYVELPKFSKNKEKGWDSWDSFEPRSDKATKAVDEDHLVPGLSGQGMGHDGKYPFVIALSADRVATGCRDGTVVCYRLKNWHPTVPPDEDIQRSNCISLSLIADRPLVPLFIAPYNESDDDMDEGDDGDEEGNDGGGDEVSEGEGDEVSGDGEEEEEEEEANGEEDVEDDDQGEGDE